MIHPSTSGMTRLRRDLLRRRWARLEPRLRIELVAIAVALAAFAFWQLRIRYAGVAFSHGAHGASMALLATLAVLLVAGGVGTALRLHQRLRGAPDGPAWLVLPLPAAVALRHQHWEAEVPLRAAFVLAAAASIASVRLAPWWVVLAASALFPFAWAACCRAGAALVRGWATRRAAVATPATKPASASGDSAAESTLRATLSQAWAIRSHSRARGRSRNGSWRRRSLVVALLAKDAWLARHSREVRLSLVPAIALSVISVAIWNVPAVRAGAFVVALLAAAAWGEWLITLGSRDPFAVLRSLPVSPRVLWCSRMVWGASATVLLVVAHAVASRGASGLLQISLVWLGVSGIAIAALAINLQLTLFPQHAPALRLFALALALSLVCSLMIPLLGWIVLLASVIHTARRLPRWWRLEEAA